MPRFRSVGLEPATISGFSASSSDLVDSFPAFVLNFDSFNADFESDELRSQVQEGQPAYQ